MTGIPTVLVTSRSFSTGDLDLRAELESAGLRVVVAGPSHDLDELGPILPEVEAWIAGAGPITDEHLSAAPRLQVIARYGVGVDAVELPAAAAHGVRVTNTPGANSEAVADHTIALLLASLRRVTAGDRSVRAGDWTVSRTRDVSSLVVGIFGLGRIGLAVARRLSGFGGVVIGHDPWVSAEVAAAANIQVVDPAELCSRSDVITLHLPGDQPLVDADWLAGVRRGLLLVNTARATLVDELALAGALRDGTVAAYAADILSGEGEGESSPLLAPDLIDRTIFTPHSAAQTVQAVDRMGRGAAASVLAVLRGEVPTNLVPTPLAPKGGSV